MISERVIVDIARQLDRLESRMNALATQDRPAIRYVESNVSSPPTDAELDTLFGTPSTLPQPFIAVIYDGTPGTSLLVWIANDQWWHEIGTLST